LTAAAAAREFGKRLLMCGPILRGVVAGSHRQG
jgi:hypothetical protein